MEPQFQPISLTPILFCNELSIGFTDNDCQLRFSVQGQAQAPASHIGMTHVTAKLLANMLTTILSDFEAKSGQEIPFDPSKLDALRHQLSVAVIPPSV